MGIWIDEKGRVVRPAEPAWTTSRTSVFGGKQLVTEGEIYVAALRDWVINGDRSAYAMSGMELHARSGGQAMAREVSETRGALLPEAGDEAGSQEA
jgi:hypothetical protein